LARSVVGLTGNFFGATSLRPLWMPDMIRISDYKKRGQEQG